MPNDSSIMYGIIFIFVSLGVITPLVHSAFNESPSSVNVVGMTVLTGGIAEHNSTHVCTNVPLGVWGAFGAGIRDCRELEEGEIIENVQLSWGSIIFSIGAMFFWTFGAIPEIIDLIILLPMRLLLGYMIYRALRSGAG